MEFVAQEFCTYMMLPENQSGPPETIELRGYLRMPAFERGAEMQGVAEWQVKEARQQAVS